MEKLYSGTAGDLTLYAKWKSTTKTTAKKQTTTLKGKVFKKGKLTYKITSVSGTRKVSVYGVKSKSVKKVVVPSTVKYGKYKYKVTAIRAGAFKNCSKLKKITIKSQSLTKIGKNALKGIHKKCKIKVPKKCYKKYKVLFKKKGQTKKVKVVK
nr:leucine-rich repeat protein [Eubacterium sp.]